MFPASVNPSVGFISISRKAISNLGSSSGGIFSAEECTITDADIPAPLQNSSKRSWTA